MQSHTRIQPLINLVWANERQKVREAGGVEDMSGVMMQTTPQHAGQNKAVDDARRGNGSKAAPTHATQLH